MCAYCTSRAHATNILETELHSPFILREAHASHVCPRQRYTPRMTPALQRPLSHHVTKAITTGKNGTTVPETYKDEGRHSVHRIYGNRKVGTLGTIEWCRSVFLSVLRSHRKPPRRPTKGVILGSRFSSWGTRSRLYAASGIRNSLATLCPLDTGDLPSIVHLTLSMWGYVYIYFHGDHG